MSGKETQANSKSITAHVVVCSDRVIQGIYKDESGPAAETWLNTHFYSGHGKTVVPDNPHHLTETVLALTQQVDLIVISGGTGLGPRDITPQTLAEICDYDIPGFGELLRRQSEKYSLNAYLSRCNGYVKQQTLILALPGNAKAVVEQLEILSDLIPHAVCALRGQCQHRRRTQEDRP